MADEVFISIDIDDAVVQAWFDYAGMYVRDARDPLGQIRDYLKQTMIEQMESKGVRSGNPYDELSTKYQSWKIAHGGVPEPNLFLTGTLYRDVTGTRGWNVTKDHLYFDFNVEYAYLHQLGGYIEGRPPQRMILDPTPEDYEYINIVFEQWLDELRDANRRRPTGDYTPQVMPDFNFMGQ